MDIKISCLELDLLSSNSMCNLFDGKDYIVIGERIYIKIKGMSLSDVHWPRATTILIVIMMVHVECCCGA